MKNGHPMTPLKILFLNHWNKGKRWHQHHWQVCLERHHSPLSSSSSLASLGPPSSLLPCEKKRTKQCLFHHRKCIATKQSCCEKSNPCDSFLKHLCITAPVSPVRRFVCTKLRDVQLISLPGALVIGQISPFNQVVVVALLIHAVHTHTNTVSHKI